MYIILDLCQKNFLKAHLQSQAGQYLDESQPVNIRYCNLLWRKEGKQTDQTETFFLPSVLDPQWLKSFYVFFIYLYFGAQS
jgi:hypothetical protein